ncbi:hypothetical protein HanRHA438_Chr14g0654331 [Helianthus annuus]|nr:hypothetical protein HanRHA438_Chr14g0654331 [Helianthus annuus]
MSYGKDLFQRYMSQPLVSPEFSPVPCPLLLRLFYSKHLHISMSPIAALR